MPGDSTKTANSLPAHLQNTEQNEQSYAADGCILIEPEKGEGQDIGGGPKGPTKYLRSNLFQYNEQLSETLNGGDVIGYNPDEMVGASGPYVGLIHSALDMLMPDNGITEKEKALDLYGISTRNAIIQFQRNHCLSDDGNVGEETLAMLDYVLYLKDRDECLAAGIDPDTMEPLETEPPDPQTMNGEGGNWYRSADGPLIYSYEYGSQAELDSAGIDGTFIGHTIPESEFGWSTLWNNLFPEGSRISDYDQYGTHHYPSMEPGLYHPHGTEGMLPINQSKLTNSGYYFEVNETVNKGNIANLVMSSFLNGDGPENIVVPDGNEVSTQFLSSNLFWKAIEDFWKNQPDSATDSRGLVGWERHYSQDVSDVIPQILASTSVKNVRNLIGGAYVTVIPKVIPENLNDVELHFEVWNTTSMTSGSATKDDFSAPRPYNVHLGDPQPYTNVGLELKTHTVFGPVDEWLQMREK